MYDILIKSSKLLKILIYYFLNYIIIKYKMNSLRELAVKQLLHIKIHLKPSEISSNIEKIIEKKVKDAYSNKCYLNGYIYGNSIEIINFSEGILTGAHLHGAMTYEVNFSAFFCIPKRDDEIKCMVVSSNKFGVIATKYPILHIVIPREIQCLHGNPELIKEENVLPRQEVVVKVLTSRLIVNTKTSEKELSVVGFIVSKTDSLPTSYSVPVISISTDTAIIVSTELPVISEDYGSNKELIDTEERLSDKSNTTEWKQIYKIINPYEILNNDIVHKTTQNMQIKRCVSRAFYKLWEILHSQNIFDGLLINNSTQNLKICCLAEAPGGFINAILNYRKNSNDVVYTTSLDGGIKYNDQITRLFSQNPDKYNIHLMDMTNEDNIVNYITSCSQKHKFDLITADGGIEKAENIYELIEHAHAKLFFAEILCALKLQQKNGTFIMKIYGMYYNITVQLIAILTSYYDDVQIVKPVTSRPTNQEKYIVCKNFNDNFNDADYAKFIQILKSWNQIETMPMTEYDKNNKFIHSIFNIDEDNVDFISTIKNINENFGSIAISKIIEGLCYYGNYEDYQSKVQNLQYTILQNANQWCKTYNLDVTSVQPTQFQIPKTQKIKSKLVVSDQGNKIHEPEIFKPTLDISAIDSKTLEAIPEFVPSRKPIEEIPEFVPKPVAIPKFKLKKPFIPSE